MIKLFFDDSPSRSGHAIRGIGTYTRSLRSELEKSNRVELVDTINNEIELIHYPYFDLFFPTLPIYKKAPTIITIHDLIPLKFPKFYKPGIRGRLNFLRQRLSLLSIKSIITDSHSSKQDIINFFNINEDKIHVIYLAANKQLEKPSEKKLKSISRKYNLPTRYILYVGDINYNKNIPQLIKSLKFIDPDIKLVLLGHNFKKDKIPEWQWIESQIALSQVEKRIKFITDLDKKSYQDFSAIYHQALCYVQPSLCEGFGLPVLEAMRCQVPVVINDNSSLREIGQDYVTVSDGSAESIAQAVKLIANLDDQDRQKMIDRAYQYSLSYTWEKTAIETINIYQQIANK